MKIFIIISICILSFASLFIGLFIYSKSWKNCLFIKPIYKLKTNKKIVALTFDDGPSKTHTKELLKILNKHNVKATFFMLGKKIEENIDIARQVFLEGHLLGNHSYEHLRLYFKSFKFIKDQIIQTDNLIRKLGQNEAKYFRPPYCAKYIVLPLVLKAMNKELVTGTYDPPAEYIIPYDSEDVSNEVINNIKPGSIVFLHDGRDIQIKEFIKSVELIIINLKEMGYSFVRLDEKECK